jgi:ABC-type lipoprotein release transport system permease subunit
VLDPKGEYGALAAASGATPLRLGPGLGLRLNPLGFTQRQLSAAVAWQATVAVVIGVIVGVPLGIVVGRQLWTLFAHNLNAVADPTVPVLSVLFVALGALIFAKLVAGLPGHTASRTPAALILRRE